MSQSHQQQTQHINLNRRNQEEAQVNLDHFKQEDPLHPNKTGYSLANISENTKQFYKSCNQTERIMFTIAIVLICILASYNIYLTYTYNCESRNYIGVFGHNPKVSVKQKVVFQNGTEIPVSILVQNEQNINKNSPYNNKDRIVPFFMWLGDLQIPERHKLMLSSLQSYIFIQNYDILIEKMENKLNKQFSSVVKNKTDIKKMNDLCKFIYLYEYGGLYSDLDTRVDYQCINKFLQGKQNHFQATPAGTSDMFFVYFRRPKNMQLIISFLKWDFYHGYSKQFNKRATAFLRQIKSKNLSRSGCVERFKQKSYINYSQNVAKQAQAQAQVK